MRKKKKLKRKIKLLLLIFLTSVGIYGYYHFENEEKRIVLNKEKVAKEKELKRIKAINDCLDYEQNFQLSIDFETIKTKITTLSSEYSLIYKEFRDNNIIIEQNGDKSFYGESIIKLPFAIYIYELALENPDLLNKELFYKASSKVGGSGIMQKMDLTRGFKISELVKYMVEESDNIAFYMLLDEFGKTEPQKYWNELGTKTTFVGGDKFGYLNGDDALIYLNKINEIIKSDNKLYEELLNNMANAAKSSLVKEIFKQDLYFKYGGPTFAYHEMFVVNDENKYALAILTDVGQKDYNAKFEDKFKNIAEDFKKMHEMYWTEKTNYCEEIYDK